MHVLPGGFANQCEASSRLERESFQHFADLVLRLTVVRRSIEVIRDCPPTRQSTEQAVDRPL